MSIHFSADQDTVDTIYRIILSVNQLSVYGAVAAICDENEGHQDSTEQPVILEGQSIVLGEIKAEVPAHDEEPREDPQEEEDVPTSSGVVAARSKAKAKPQPRESAGATTIPLSERIWIDIEPSKQDLESYNLFEESHHSSSTQSEVTSRRRWSNSILQDKVPSTRPSSSNTKLVR